MLPLEKWNSFLGLIHINCTRNSEVYSSCLFCIIWCKFYKAICFGFVDVSPDFFKKENINSPFFCHALPAVSPALSQGCALLCQPWTWLSSFGGHGQCSLPHPLSTCHYWGRLRAGPRPGPRTRRERTGDVLGETEWKRQPTLLSGL